MAVLEISQLSRLNLSYEGARRDEAGESRPADGPAAGPRPLMPQDLHHEPRLRTDLLTGFHGLSPEEARASAQELGQRVARMTPWRAAELQAVADPGLLPSAYV
jgi:hypothetical protein